MKAIRISLAVLLGVAILVLAAKERQDRAVTQDLERTLTDLREEVRRGKILADREDQLEREIHELGLRLVELDKIISPEQYREARRTWPWHPCLQRRWE